MKQCCSCKEIKSDSEFYTKKSENRLDSRCKSCFSQYCMDRWKRKKEEAVLYMGGGCNKCGYSKCIAALEFHHIDPSTKDFSWNKLRLQSPYNIKKELDKCILLCANCHREEHHHQGVLSIELSAGIG